MGYISEDFKLFPSALEFQPYMFVNFMNKISCGKKSFSV